MNVSISDWWYMNEWTIEDRGDHCESVWLLFAKSQQVEGNLDLKKIGMLVSRDLLDESLKL